MSQGLNGSPAPRTVRCPNCRVLQEWSLACRRCKSDLQLLHAFADEYERRRDACLLAIRSGDPAAASNQAQRCHALEPGPDSRRLLALAALLRGDWSTATALASRDD